MPTEIRSLLSKTFLTSQEQNSLIAYLKSLSAYEVDEVLKFMKSLQKRSAVALPWTVGM
jgi:hypothetical protein